MENAYPRGAAEAQLAPLVSQARAVQVHCMLEPEQCARRYVARFERGERHACHFDAERIARVQSGQRQIDWSRYEPLDLDVPLVCVRTENGYAPALEEVLDRVRGAVLEAPR